MGVMCWRTIETDRVNFDIKCIYGHGHFSIMLYLIHVPRWDTPRAKRRYQTDEICQKFDNWDGSNAPYTSVQNVKYLNML